MNNLQITNLIITLLKLFLKYHIIQFDKKSFPLTPPHTFFKILSITQVSVLGLQPAPMCCYGPNGKIILWRERNWGYTAVFY